MTGAAATSSQRWLSERARGLRISGIRRVFELGASLKDPINLSIGQPDFPVPDPIKRAAIEAIEQDHNGYTLSQGIPQLRRRIVEHLAEDVGWPANSGEPESGVGVMVTSGTSGALSLMMQALLSPGDEIIIPDPYFVAYPTMAELCGGVAVCCDTYPDFRMTAERLEPLINERTKAVLLNSPGNPGGAVMSGDECREVLELCRSKGVLLVSDEIYDEFTFDDHREETPSGRKCPSPAREAGSHEDVLLIRGFGKSYGCTGWRMGYAAGPTHLIDAMTRFQQFTYVCAPSIAQHGCLAAFETDIDHLVESYRARRDMVVSRLSAHTTVTEPGGAFYCFVEVPERLGFGERAGERFFERAIEENVLLIPGHVFSDRDTHVRVSFATSERNLERGLDALDVLLRG